MLYNAKNGNIKTADIDMDYISFGTGKKNLIIIPGLGDALKTVRGMAVTLAFMYRLFAKDYTVYVFSRKNNLRSGCSTRDMTADQASAMKALGITKASVMGVSQGGMIAQYLAVDYSELVEKLVLVATLGRQNDTVQSALKNWIALAQAGDFKSIFIDTAERTYSEKRLKGYRAWYPVLSWISKPKSLNRFILQANACINHDAYDDLARVHCSTLIIGGDEDKIVGGKAALELAEKIPESVLKIYPGLGHGVYEEAQDFNTYVLDFLNA